MMKIVLVLRATTTGGMTSPATFETVLSAKKEVIMCVLLLFFIVLIKELGSLSMFFSLFYC